MKCFMMFSVAFLTVLLPTTSWAQEPVQELNDLGARVSTDDRVRVFTVDGQMTEGRLQLVSDDAVTLLVSGSFQELLEVNIREISRRRPDTLWNGAGIGAGIGGFIGLGAVGACSELEANCAAGELLAFGVAMAAGGAGIGALLDHLVYEYDTVFDRATSSARFDLTPVISRENKGLQLNVSF